MKGVKKMSYFQVLLLLFGIILICCFMPNMGQIMEGMCGSYHQGVPTSTNGTCNSQHTDLASCNADTANMCRWS